MSAQQPNAIRRNIVATAMLSPFLRFAVGAEPQQQQPEQTQFPLWPGTPPGGGGPGGAIATSKKGAVSNVSSPFLTKFTPQQANGAAVLVAAGGGYKRMEMASEAYPAATWLTAHGITAFVLTYRLPGEGWAAGASCALQDAQRAIRLIRANAHNFGIDPQKVGVLGFSAGGHLMGMASARSGFESYAEVDGVDTQSARPDHCALIYPVVTLEPPYDNTSTRKELVGRHPSLEQERAWSVQTHVRGHCPDMFLIQAEDDPISDPHNTLIMAQACRDANIAVEIHRFAHGGHGFGMGVPGTETAQWPDFYATWLRARQFLA